MHYKNLSANLIIILILTFPKAWLGNIYASSDSASAKNRKAQVNVAGSNDDKGTAEENQENQEDQADQEFKERNDSSADEDYDQVIDAGLDIPLSTLDIISQHGTGMHLGLGQAKPRTELSLTLFRQADKSSGIGFFMGAESSRITDKLDSRDYRMELKAQTFGAEWRYFPSPQTAIYLSPGLSYSSYTGTIRTLGANTDDEQTSLDNIETSFKAQGLTAHVAINYVKAFENRLYFEVAIVGVARSWLLVKNSDRGGRAMENILNDAIESPFAYGMLNIQLGYLL